MQSEVRKTNKEYILTIYNGHNGGETTPKRTKLIELVRDPESKSTEIYLPEENETASSFWIPEIVYKREEPREILEIVIRPRPSFFCQQKQDIDRVPAASCRQEGARDDSILYEVTVSNREIRINGFKLSKPNFYSENEIVFDYLYRNANKTIELADLEQGINKPINKKLREIIRDLGFIKELRDMFFPGVSKAAVIFINPITKTDFERRGLRAPGIRIE